MTNKPELIAILNEAADILAGAIAMRFPIVDELHGFALMLADEPNPSVIDCGDTVELLHSISHAVDQRERFERACYDHYLTRHAAGQLEDSLEPLLTREGLLWRDDKGNYGVLMFNAAWFGFQAASKSIAGPVATPVPVQQAAPSAWIDKWGNVFPLAAYSVDGKPNYHDQHKRGWSPLYRAVPNSPIDMILHCPACHLQHIDAPDERTPEWKNEPHRSHLCHGCGHIWRPADVPTNGVATTKTKGKSDSPTAAPAQPVGLSEQDRLDAARLDFIERDWFYKNGKGELAFSFIESWTAGKGSLRECIDADILAAKEAP